MVERNLNDSLDQQLEQVDECGLLRTAFASSKVAANPVDLDRLIQNDRPKAQPRVENWFASNHLASMAVGICIFAAIGFFFLPSVNNEGSAFAWQDFRQHLENVSSIQFFESESFPGTDQPNEYRRVMILGKHRKRVEQGQPKNKLEQLRDTFKGQMGLETEPAHSILISDLRAGKAVSLEPDEKRCVLYTFQASVDREDKELLKNSGNAHPEVDFYSRLRNVPHDATTVLGKQKIDGREATGFGVECKWGLNSSRSEEYWIDDETLLPLKIVGRITPGKDSRRSAQTWTLTGFKFDQPLDEMLFSTEPPDGFTVEEGSIQGIE